MKLVSVERSQNNMNALAQKKIQFIISFKYINIINA